MDVWTKVVEDLQKYNEPKVEKTFLQRMWNIIFNNDGCKSDGCHQGRNPGGCNCDH